MALGGQSREHLVQQDNGQAGNYGFRAGNWKLVRHDSKKARNMIVELPTWTGGSLRVANTPVKHSRTPGGATRGASRPGEHTEEILRQAGLTETQIADLIARGIAATGPAPARVVAGAVE